MCKNCELTFDQFMLSYVNAKQEFDFELLGLKLRFTYKQDSPMLIISDNYITKEYRFNTPYDLCRLSFNGTPFAELFFGDELVCKTKIK